MGVPSFSSLPFTTRHIESIPVRKADISFLRSWALFSSVQGGGMQEEGEKGVGNDQGIPAVMEVEDGEEIAEFHVTAKEGMLPLDILLVRRFPELSRRACRRLLQEGRVRVNGRVTTRLSKLGTGRNLLRVLLPRGGMASSIGLGFQLLPEKMNLTPSRSRTRALSFSEEEGRTGAKKGREGGSEGAREGGSEGGREGGIFDDAGEAPPAHRLDCDPQVGREVGRRRKNRARIGPGSARPLGLKRVLLHAYSLAFVHPARQTPLTLLAPLPRDMLSVAQFVLSKGPGPTGNHEDKRKLLRLLRDGEPLTPALGHDVASPVPSTVIASNAPSIGATGGEAAEATDLEEEEWDEED
ncbi:hypothetical protein NSK_005690 [Nannochloropsis salina CCMP1776]|uniref:RNA-binding S4 domain-containing protein n=1 Tax=Nannochloropsis salina CCMP1776 TaxID=1027361 RepID=A0A4D9CUM3_9STRA|nr:hypothetical protein NSK_005690 [Nannochloropsis salina CCMP1776]|eukprot:TFJ83001.1 hypothetical protein NSK_005690 [Nannochloropsis salina CCMP1776]